MKELMKKKKTDAPAEAQPISTPAEEKPIATPAPAPTPVASAEDKPLNEEKPIKPAEPAPGYISIWKIDSIFRR